MSVPLSGGRHIASHSDPSAPDGPERSPAEWLTSGTWISPAGPSALLPGKSFAVRMACCDWPAHLRIQLKAGLALLLYRWGCRRSTVDIGDLFVRVETPPGWWTRRWPGGVFFCDCARLRRLCGA